MSILTVNLKHLYQRRGMLVLYLFFGVIGFTLVRNPLLRIRTRGGDFIGSVVLPFLLGFLLTMPAVGVLSKPLSYCLPGHRRMFRRYVFAAAIATSFLCSLLFLNYPGLSGGPLVLVVCSAFFAGVTCYMVGVAHALVGMNGWVIFAIGPILIIFGEHYDWDVLLEQFIVGNVFTVCLVGILSSVAMWLWLGREGLARRYCGRMWVGFMDAFNKEKMNKYGHARLAAKKGGLGKHPRPWVDKWFFGKMEKYDYSGPGRFYWGSLYSTSALAVSRWQTFLILVPVITIMFGYVGQSVVLALVMVPVILVIGRQPPVYSTMMISGGRHRRFTTTWRLVVTDASLLAILVLAVSGLSILLARFMPTVTIDGHSVSFQSIDPRVAIVPFLFMPFASTMQLIFRRMPFLLFGALMLPMYASMFLGIMWREQVEPLVNPLSVLSLLVVCWCVFLIVLRRVCSKWCLVAERRRH